MSEKAQLVFPLGSRIVVMDPPATATVRAGVVLPPNADVDQLGRGIVVRLPETMKLRDADDDVIMALPDLTAGLLRPGDVVYFSRFFRLGDVKVVDLENVIGYEKTAPRE